MTEAAEARLVALTELTSVKRRVSALLEEQRSKIVRGADVEPQVLIDYYSAQAGLLEVSRFLGIAKGKARWGELGYLAFKANRGLAIGCAVEGDYEYLREDLVSEAEKGLRDNPEDEFSRRLLDVALKLPDQGPPLVATPLP